MDIYNFTGWLYKYGVGGRENIRSDTDSGTDYLAGG